MTNLPDQPIRFEIDDPSKIGEARRSATTLTRALGFDETEQGKAALIASEAASNLLKHAGRGDLIFNILDREDGVGLEVLALDRGPGMSDVSRCLDDGFSTTGTPGNGLGALRRLATEFDIYSIPGEGTVLMARLWRLRRERPESPPVDYGVVASPAVGEEVCGDAWGLARHEDSNTSLAMIADGLGHGPLAAEAARAAVAAFHEQIRLGPVGILEAAHAALKSTRGAAMAVAQMDRERGEVRFAGVGNIGGFVSSAAESRRVGMVSQNGIVGHTVRKVREYTYPWNGVDLLVMHSDGLGSQWSLDRYPGASAKSPSLIAGLLYRDYKRGRDDVTVLVAREISASRP
ncbi:SpoIIE family protein phosphatase [Singulisphaera sp. PoT]|uniref:SpoIIE family protein phosphatase n=1 Tax=Singulisphaera sp. PoT TaxID=3411797 RepID=UPI003BF4D6B7